MDRRNKHLSGEERGVIFAEHKRGSSQRSIGQPLHRPASTIWSCPACVSVSHLIYATFRSNAKGLLPPSDECRRRGL